MLNSLRFDWRSRKWGSLFGSILRFSCLSVYTWCQGMWNNSEAFPVILLAFLIPSSPFLWFLTSLVSFPQHPHSPL
ncbi:hypothetical protein AAG906_032364 [Vitis piasezkii]